MVVFFSLLASQSFPGGPGVKNPLAMQERQVPSLGWEDPLQKEMATHSSGILAFSYCSWGSQGKNTEVVCPSPILWPPDAKSRLIGKDPAAGKT